MKKKFITLGIAFLMLFSLAACRHPTDSFISLEEMQMTLPANFYYFDFNLEGIEEVGKFEATKKKQSDGTYRYIQYFIWYNVEYVIDGKIITRKLRVVAADAKHTMTFLGKNATSFAPQPDLSEIDANCYGVGYSAKDNLLLLTIDIKNEEGIWYYFVLDGVKNVSVAVEAELFVKICETSINDRYKK